MTRWWLWACLATLGCASAPSSPHKVKSCAEAHALAEKASAVRVLVYFENVTATRRHELDAVLGEGRYEPVDEVGDAALIEVDEAGIAELCASDRIEQLSAYIPTP